MNWLETFASGIITAVITSGLLTWIIKKYVDLRFKLIQQREKTEIDFQVDERKAWLSKRRFIFPELLQLCYKAKLIAEECIQHTSVSMQDVQDFTEITKTLTERLKEYRLFVPKNTWTVLHKTKHLCQNFLIYLEILERVVIDQGEKVIIDEAEKKAVETAHALSKKLQELDDVLRKDIEKLIGTAL
ncbi:MAG: hypothetical protein GY839_09970 [candidate division Zixibacteria bacterium]|nr:hypothetical protein [candidate division Zixibacteria bacterium]